jgi:uncharacterized protein GlcG (DUF336 family)
MNIAVVENLVAHVRMDEVWIGSIDISFDISTKDLAKKSQPGGQFYGIHASNDDRVVIFAGGIPLKRQGHIVGVSGGSG